MRLNILILILMALLAVCMFFVGKNSTDQTKEIRRLRWRVDNLETVINGLPDTASFQAVGQTGEVRVAEMVVNLFSDEN